MLLKQNPWSRSIWMLAVATFLAVAGIAAAQEGTAVIALPSEAQTLDAQITTAEVTSSISGHWLEKLVAFDSNWAPQPMLAEKVSLSEGALVYTFDLRQGVMFHNGDELMADDVVASLLRWLDVSSRARSAKPYVDEIVATGDYAVEIRLNAPFAPMLSLLAGLSAAAGIYPAAVIEKYGSEPIQDHIGTGPYEFVAWLPDRHVEVRRFDGYQPRSEPSDGYSGAAVANFETIRFVTVPETATRIAGIQTGEYDYAWQIAPDSYAALEMDPRVDTVIRKPGLWGVAFFNKREGLMTNQTLRQAVNAALDNEELLIAGAGPAEFWNLEHNYMVSDTPFKTDVGADQYNQANPERARQLAAEAGYDGETIRWLVSPDYNQHYQMSLAAEQQLEAAGFNVELIAVEWATLLDLRSQPDKWDIFVTHHSFVPDPVLIDALSATYPGWWDEPRHDELMQALHSATSLDERQGAWEETLAYMWDYLPSIMIGEWYGLDIKSPDFQLGEAATLTGKAYWNSSRAE